MSNVSERKNNKDDAVTARVFTIISWQELQSLVIGDLLHYPKKDLKDSDLNIREGGRGVVKKSFRFLQPTKQF